MAENILAIFLVTLSASGSQLVFNWPPNPRSQTRLARAKPTKHDIELNNPGKAIYADTLPLDPTPVLDLIDEEDYIWRANHVAHQHDLHAHDELMERKSPGTSSPRKDDYDDVSILGYSVNLLSSFLAPRHTVCHQQFELLVEDLLFIGHPVCADPDGVWRVKADKNKPGSRGRNSTSAHTSTSDQSTAATGDEVKSSWLTAFHLCVVLDMPDPSSATSSDVSKYIDIIYERVAFATTALMYSEQILSNLVEDESELLGTLKEQYHEKHASYSQFLHHATAQSTIASCIKTLYESLTNSQPAHLRIGGSALDVRLPPHLSAFLNGDEEVEDKEALESLQDDELVMSDWGPEFGLGWKLPVLAPWKTILLLDTPDGNTINLDALSGPQSNTKEKTLAGGLVHFLRIADVTRSFADMAKELNWDIARQLYPVVRRLVYLRLAIVVDTVHRNLKTVFTLPPKFELPLSTLVERFNQDFTETFILPLPVILARVSSSSSKQSDNHFYATVVSHDRPLLGFGAEQTRNKTLLLEKYHSVVRWMLKHDLLVTLHLRIRVVATSELKKRVKIIRDARRRARDSNERLEPISVSMRKRTGSSSMSRVSSGSHLDSLRNLDTDEDVFDEEAIWDDSDEQNLDEREARIGPSFGSEPSIIADPGKPSSVERRWLAGMSLNKDPAVVAGFERINRYFDGKHTDDEILYRAGIKRKQLKEVLQHYDDYVSYLGLSV